MAQAVRAASIFAAQQQLISMMLHNTGKRHSVPTKSGFWPIAGKRQRLLQK
jgi:hypothetical protein